MVPSRDNGKRYGHRALLPVQSFHLCNESHAADSPSRPRIAGPLQPFAKLELRDEIVHHLRDRVLRSQLHGGRLSVPARPSLAILQAEDDVAFARSDLRKTPVNQAAKSMHKSNHDSGGSEEDAQAVNGACAQH